MLERLLTLLVSTFGYALMRRDAAAARARDPQFLHTFKKADGSLDYERYRAVQEEGNARKIDKVWVTEENIAFLSCYLRDTIGQPQFGICHGSRRGHEQDWFRKYLGCDVIGTEISKTATEFPNTIQWDFHDVKPEWLSAVDFVYSNSFDHSYDPEKCLNAWMSCVRPGGICLIEHSNAHEPSGANELDPFGADLLVMPYLIATWGQGRYVVRQLLKAPGTRGKSQWVWFIAIQKL